MVKRIVWLLLIVASTWAWAAAGAQGPAPARDTVVFPIFWTWTDRQIDDRALMTREIDDIAAAGYGSVYTMVRATRYNLFDPEVTAAAAFASRLCRERGLEFVWGADPRFGATHIVRKTGFGAQMLMVNREFQTTLTVAPGADPETALLNETRVTDGRYSLRYNYPARRDLHMLTEVSLWLNPVSVEKVYAYRRDGGRVVRASVRDITPSHRLFVNRAFNYVEVFGHADLPAGEWFVFAFPRFDTNMYAYDAPEHEREFLALVDTYKAQGLDLDGFWWDEPGYYFQFGHYAIGKHVYDDFARKYGYRLEDTLYALPLALDDDSQIRVRHDYFHLLMDYVYGGQRRLLARGEQAYGPLRMGIHHTWHWLPDDAYAGAGDLWRGLEAVDGGYTDTSGGFEKYFTAGLMDRYVDASRLVIAKSLARFSRTGRAYYNTWGVEFGNEVPVYWNDLMAAFSNEWIAHCYGYTGVIGADRSFGPGFPNHSSWALAAGFNERNRKVLGITGFVPASADVAVVFPVSTVLTASGGPAQAIVTDVHRLIGVMPALGLQSDAISPSLLGEGVLDGHTLRIRTARYRALLLPHAAVMPGAAVAVVRQLLASGFPVHFTNAVTTRTTEGERVSFDATPRFDIPQDPGRLAAAVESLGLPSPCGRLEGAYLNVIPAPSGASFVTVMPIDPKVPVAGTVTCFGQPVNVSTTSALNIFRIDTRPPRVTRVF
ncbi:MAG: hypothetical protein Q7V01_02650 [Vicinamibacterales bacterium]|nr:hypothetical protein [Vicinamibacterales bacterium]